MCYNNNNNKLLLLLLCVCTAIVSAQQTGVYIKQDLFYLNNLFFQSGGYSVIKVGYPSSILNGNDFRREIEAPGLYNVSCIRECLKHPHCARFTHNPTLALCKLSLSIQRRAFTYSRTVALKIRELTGIDLENCTSDVQCTDTQEKVILKKVSLCNVWNHTGGKCQYNVTHELSLWSAWTACSMTCDSGIRSRSRTCIRKHFSELENRIVSETTVHEAWCRMNTAIGTLFAETEDCLIQNCTIHGQWSAWSSCSKACDGTQRRTRTCFYSKDAKDAGWCEYSWLNEEQPCGYRNCTLFTLSFDEVSMQNTGPITSGILAFNNLNAASKVSHRILTFTNDSTELNKIGKIACEEFGMDGVASVNGTLFKSSESNKVDLNQDFYGLRCVGNENFIEDCRVEATIESTSQDLYEIDLKCIVSGYWSWWDSWEECSRTCGVGYRQRYRKCDNPPATITSLSCPINDTVSGQQCTLARCPTTTAPTTTKFDIDFRKRK